MCDRERQAGSQSMAMRQLIHEFEVDPVLSLRKIYRGKFFMRWHHSLPYGLPPPVPS